LEESVTALFPEAQVARLDRDIARRKGALEETLAAFRSGDIQILVGTQMVAKGLDFPNVTLVGAILADMSLNIPDFRSSERTFQLLCQVAGRSGRGQAPGTVVVQTFNPEHPAVRAARTHDYLTFYESLLVERRDAQYPPFRRLVNIEISGEARGAVVRAADEAFRRLRHVTQEILGPVDCAIERLAGRWRKHILLKLPPYGEVAPVGEALSGFAPDGVQVTVDADPYSVM
jgi:primosomal protein N' (replication factor Y)